MFSIDRLFIASMIASSFALAGCSGTPTGADDVRVTTEQSTSPKCRLAIEKTFAAENMNLSPICEGGTTGIGGGGGGGGGGSTSSSSSGGTSSTGGSSGELPEWAADVIRASQAYGMCLETCGTEREQCNIAIDPYVGNCSFVVVDGVRVPLSVKTADVPSCVAQYVAQCQKEYVECQMRCERLLNGF
jgi:hypothetical protein